MKDQTLRQTAAHILAAALFEMFPQVDLWEAQATDTGFVCECHFPHPINKDTLPLIEQRMRQIVQEARPIRLIEMAPVSAAALLSKEGHKEESALLKEWQQPGMLVELIEMGSFHQLTEGPLLAKTSELTAFSLLSVEKLPDRGIRIEGTACESKEVLKKFIKSLSTLAKKNYQTIGQQLKFWVCGEEGMVWLEKGLQERQKIQELFFLEVPLVEWRGQTAALWSFFQKDCRFVKGDSTKDLRSSSFALEKVLFTSPKEFSAAMNSLLHSLLKTFIMLDFNCQLKALGKRRAWREIAFPAEISVEWEEGLEPRIDWVVEDFLGRKVLVASIRKLDKLQDGLIVLTCEAFIERILVLVLEKRLRIEIKLGK